MSTTTSTQTTTTKATQRSGSISVTTLPSSPPTVSSYTNAHAGPSPSSTVSTLRSLYPRAAHALLQRDFSLTQSLLEYAFELLGLSPETIPDALDMHRRKWEILRITLETSAYSTPPAGKYVGADEVLPPSLRANLMLSAPGLITTLHSRAVRLFTPKRESPKAAYLPAQILVPLVLSSLKLECPEVGRSMIEDWLAQRVPVDGAFSDGGGYERVLELYSLHVLPRLHEWEYAHEFLEYENELPKTIRQRFKSTLRGLQTKEIEAARMIPSPPPHFSTETPSMMDSRTASPSPSVQSTSSSDTDDTHSTRTVVPRTSRGKGMNGLTPLTPTLSTSATSLEGSKHLNGHASHTSPPSTFRAESSHSSHSLSHATNSQQGTVSRRVPTSSLSHITSVLRLYLSRLGPSRLLFAVLCVLVPVFSFIMRIRRRQQQRTSGTLTTGVDEVRRRLDRQPRGNMLGTLWAEAVRAVGDTVRMAGSGLV